LVDRDWRKLGVAE